MRDEARSPSPDSSGAASASELRSERVIGRELELVFELAPIGMAISSLDSVLLEVNQALCKTLGYAREALKGLSHAKITHAEDLEKRDALTHELVDGRIPHFELEHRYLTADGRTVHALTRAGLIRDDAGAPLHLVTQIIDITERREMEERLRYAAEHDPLTGLPNRVAFMKALRAHRGSELPFGVIFLDLDQFKIVNDSLGHQAGDELLVLIARRLRDTLSDDHMLSRHGGDEFTVLLSGVGTTQPAIEVAHHMQAALTMPFDLQGQDVFASASIGIALGIRGSATLEEILRNADTAMYRAKSKGRGRQVVFDDTMHAKVVKRLTVETDLRRGVKNGDFLTYFQPIVRLAKDAPTVGFEALMRWRHPSRGLIKPDEYLEVAEDTGQIIPLGNWILNDACQSLAGWRRLHGANAPEFVSVNVSNRQFAHPEFAVQVEEALLRSGLPPECLRLEITETVIMDYGLETQILLAHLRDLGCRLYVDDFGTGYSSLAHLHRLPIDALKIDRGFVQGTVPRGDGLEIVKAIISLAKNLNLEVIAEGIETEEQLEQLQLLGCKLGQGYLFAEPMSYEDATNRMTGDLPKPIEED